MQCFFKAVLLILFNYFLFINYVQSIKYNIKIKGTYSFDNIENKLSDMKDLKLTKLNKTHWTINGVMSILRDDIPRSRLKASIRGATKWGNGYQDSSLLQINNLKFCDMWDNDTVFIGPLKKSINITNLPCPYPRGPFAIVNYIPDTSKLPPFLPAKDWRIDYIVYDEDKKVAHDRLFVEFTPDKS